MLLGVISGGQAATLYSRDIATVPELNRLLPLGKGPFEHGIDQALGSPINRPLSREKTSRPQERAFFHRAWT